MEAKDWIGLGLTVWANIVATAALIHTIRKDKKTAKPRKPRKRQGRR